LILLESIDPSRNRRRAYSIRIEPSSPTKGYCVRTSWGRAPRRSHARKKTFPQWSEALTYVAALLAVRKRHGYALVVKTDAFPHLDILDEFPTAKPDGQLWLFPCH
jgi:predicted DNA-binding WGR domain protein